MIVEIRPGDNKWTADLIFDDGSTLKTSREFVEKTGIFTGQEVDINVLEMQIAENSFEKCYEAALHFLEYRARSEGEVRDYLFKKKRVDSVFVERCLDKLKQVRLIDDASFAELWMQDRLTYKPRSRFMIKKELLQKGIDNELAGRVTEDIDDTESAYTAGLKKAKLLCNLEYPDFYKRLAGYLSRRGFSSDVVHRAITRLWKTTGKNLSENT
ncbi:MAG: RecX family transcriptional regulator [Dehalococcoidia bacterium]|nr:RecX family transcriptional regulator [Dehalococcoidia bacterium]